VVQDQLDLHGLTRAEAHEALAAFLRTAVRYARRCVRIVHGKGLGSKNREPVLKVKVKVWLARRQEVLAFCQAPPAHGGSGAVLVLLRA
jgi:DNA-nicking Smr family endonuclease